MYLIRGHISGNHTSRGNYCTFADRHAGKDRGSRANPSIIAYDDRLVAVIRSFFEINHVLTTVIEDVVSTQDVHRWSEHNMVANLYLSMRRSKIRKWSDEDTSPYRDVFKSEF